jgi:acyl-CoA dehydrogenase
VNHDLLPGDLAIRAKARALADDVLMPLEQETDQHGSLPRAHWARVKDEVLAHGLNAINHRAEHGGQGLSLFQQALVNEQLGRLTCGLYATVWHPAIPLARGTPAQIERFLRPTCRGELRDCFAITEEGAGSDPRRVRTAAHARAGGWALTGRKWHVTSFSGADYIIVHAHVDGDADKPTLFLVDKDLPGVRHVRSPKYMHTWPFDHAELQFDDVLLTRHEMLGEVGQGFDLTKEWFVETRLTIAARMVGSAARAIETAERFARDRVQHGQAIIGFQAIEFMLADSATEIMAAQALLYRVARALDAGTDGALAHGLVAAAKLHCTEMAGRVVDRALQILGGRGYMRENPVERLYRDVRVDRIWEGTSEIQRGIIGRQIRKRGMSSYTGH